MGYDVSFMDPNGEAYANPEGVNPSTEMGVTYNFKPLYLKHGFHVRDLHGLTGKEVSWGLRRIIKSMDNYSTHSMPDEWSRVRGISPLAALQEMLRWAEQHPEGLFGVCN